jgi:membrane protein implicated in regulation of membrane protease activity
MFPAELTNTNANRRRLTGGLLLGAAVLMLILGETALKGRLSPVSWLGYWAVCMLFTATSMVLAFADVRALSRRTRREQHELFEQTVKDIEADARQRRPKPGNNGKGRA